MGREHATKKADLDIKLAQFRSEMEHFEQDKNELDIEQKKFVQHKNKFEEEMNRYRNEIKEEKEKFRQDIEKKYHDLEQSRKILEKSTNEIRKVQEIEAKKMLNEDNQNMTEFSEQQKLSENYKQDIHYRNTAFTYNFEENTPQR